MVVIVFKVKLQTRYSGYTVENSSKVCPYTCISEYKDSGMIMYMFCLTI